MDDEAEHRRADAEHRSTPDPNGGQHFDTAIYDELRRLAHAYFRREPAAHTLQPTALVHEAYLRLADYGGAFRERGHFLAVAATAMRHILVERARRRHALRHGGGRQRVSLSNAEAPSDTTSDVDLIALDDALCRLAALDDRKSRIIEMRFFAGAGIDETAQALGIARSTVTEDWRMARAWLARELEGAGP